MDVLLEHGADLNAQDFHGDTPLMQAIKSNRVDVVDRLLEYSPNLQRTNNQGQTAIGRACQNKNTAMVDLLLQRGASITDRQGWYLLILVCKKQEGKVDLQNTSVAWLLISAYLCRQQQQSCVSRCNFKRKR